MYCIPSDADRILRVDPSTASCSYVGRDLSDIAKGQSRGQNKWQNGFAGGDGCIYAIPLKCERVLRIDPSKEDCASLIGGPFEGLNLWEGGVAAATARSTACRLKCDRVMRTRRRAARRPFLPGVGGGGHRHGKSPRQASAPSPPLASARAEPRAARRAPPPRCCRGSRRRARGAPRASRSAARFVGSNLRVAPFNSSWADGDDTLQRKSMAYL